MKIPQYIKNAIIKSAKHSEIANKLNEKIRDWMLDKNIYNDINIDCLIDSTETSNTPMAFINYLENDVYEGNEKEYR